MIRIMLADDHTLFRQAARQVLEANHDLVVVGEAGSGETVVAAAQASHPDVVLLDISMPGIDGLEAARQLKRALPRVRVLMLTVYPEQVFALRALEQGADGYLIKQTTPEQLVEAIRKVHAGGKYLSPALGERLAEALGGSPARPPLDRLSARELEVLRRIAAGRSTHEIGREMGLTACTVSALRRRMLEKLHLATVAQLTRYAVETTLVN